MVSCFFKCLKYKIKCLIFRIASKELRIDEESLEEIHVNEKNVNYFSLSSNTIKIIKQNEKTYYFRECLKHGSREEFVHEQIERFFKYAVNNSELDNFDQVVQIQTHFSDNVLNSFRKVILECEKRRGFYNQILTTDMWVEIWGFSIWSGNTCLKSIQLHKIGLDVDIEKFNEILPYFVWYMRGVSYSYRLNSFVKKNHYETFNACRSILSWEIAKLFNCEKLFTSSKMVRLYIDDEVSIGVLSEKAPGKRALDVNIESNTSLQRLLTILNVIDAICYQKDHYANNYNIIVNNHKVSGVCAFDNDNQFAFFPICNPAFVSQRGGTPILKKDNSFAREHLDYEFANKILTISMNELKQTAMPFLNRLQLRALLIRFKIVQNAIRNKIEENSDFLWKEGQWNEEFLKKELQGVYGKTYLWLFDNKYY